MAKGKAKKAPTPAAATAAPAGRGGAGRGQGRKRAGATPAAKPAGPDPSDTTKQQTLGDLLGLRNLPAVSSKRPAVPAADVIKWGADVDGEDVPQKQVHDGQVRWTIEPEKEYVLVKAGSTETEHTYWHDSDGNEVPEGDARAVGSRVRGGPAWLRIHEVGAGGVERWVTKGHVFAVGFGKRQRGVEDVLGARREEQEEESEEEQEAADGGGGAGGSGADHGGLESEEEG
eukprot:7390778-Prymnesium_polylepis.1